MAQADEGATLLPSSIASSLVRIAEVGDLELTLGVFVDGQGVDDRMVSLSRSRSSS